MQASCNIWRIWHPGISRNINSAMAEHQYGERGGDLPGLRLDASPAIGAHADRQLFEAFSTSSSPQHTRFSPAYLEHSSGVTSAVQSLTSDSTPDSKLELSLDDAAARKGMLENTIFPTLRNDAGGANLDTPEEMQKNDPLATQIWRLYSKAKTQLPNAERMENLTWRMMAMNMRRAEQERNKGYGIRHAPNCPSTCDFAKSHPKTPFANNCCFLAD